MRIYFMGIGGVAMGHAALLARQLGHTVLGVDGPIYPPMSQALQGLEIYQGYNADRLAQLRPDAVVIGNAIGRGNPEVEWFWQHKPCPYFSLPEFLRSQVLHGRHTIAICGTHGKTTTTTLTAYLLQQNKIDTGWLIGGVPQDLPSGANVGSPAAPFVIEGDEYDSAFFDKRAKFISYTPTIAVINNLEPDHLDIYRDIEDLRRSFNHMLRTVPAGGVVIANRDDENVRSILPISWVPTLWVSATDDPAADLHIRNFSQSPSGSSFDLFWRGQHWGRISWALPGLFNARNAAMAALAAGWSANKENPTAISLNSLSTFVGVKRRQEVRYQDSRLLVVEDFAHHPTAITLTMQAVRQSYPQHHWIACMEARSNTSRTNTHQATFPAALALADQVVLPPVYAADRLAANIRLDMTRLATDIGALGAKAHLVDSCADIPARLHQLTQRTGPVGVIFFTNGSFEGAMQGYIDSLSATPATI